MTANGQHLESIPMRAFAASQTALVRQLCLFALTFCPILGAGTTLAQDAPKRYAQVSASNASIRNLSDDKGVKVDAPAQGALVAVFSDTSNGWSLVEVPGGFPVCVFGKYLKSTAEQDVYEVTRNAVNIRPGPSSDIRNYPLPQRLHAGDRVRLIEKLDGAKPMAESWARIWSPPGVRAYIKSTELKGLASAQSGAALWASALLDVAGPRSIPSIAKLNKPGSSIKPAAEAKSARTQEAWTRDLDAARDLLREESKKDVPNIPAVRAMFMEFLAQSPPANLAKSARDSLVRIDALEEASQLVAEVKEQREQRRQEILGRQNDVIEAARIKDPLGEVLLSRGILFRRRENDQAPRYFLRFGRTTVAEVKCASGRYNLELFAGHQVGVQGISTELAAAGLGQQLDSRVPLVDISRIELTQLRR